MMRFGRLVTMLTLGSAMLIGGALLYGRSQPDPNRLRTLEIDLCDGKPCWKEIIPGVTDWNTFRNRSGSQGQELTNADSIGVQFEEDGHTVTALGHQEPTVVISIGLSAHDAFLLSNAGPGRVGDVLALFGTPCGIEKPINMADMKGMTLLYPNAVINVPIVGERIDLNTPISDIALVDPTLYPSLVSSDLCKSKSAYIVLPWKGLASTSSYYSQ